MRFQGNDVFFGTPTSTYPSTNNFVHINTQSGVSMIIGGHSGTHTAVQFRHNGSTVCGAIVITSTSTSYNSGSSDKSIFFKLISSKSSLRFPSKYLKVFLIFLYESAC